MFNKNKNGKPVNQADIIPPTLEEVRESQPGVKLFLNGVEGSFLTVKIGNCTHQGAREYQEDSFGYSDIIDSEVISRRGFAAVLADGMGGLSNGKEISDYVVRSFISMFEALDISAENNFGCRLIDIAEKINAEVSRNFFKDGRSGAGSTIAAAIVYKAKLFWVCMGDSRLYLLRNNILYTVNEDHDYFNQLLSDNLAGKITIAEINADKQKDSLTSYVGNEKLPFIDASKIGFSLQKDDTLLLCSDGIYAGLSNAEIISILNHNEPQRASEIITASVLDKNIAGQDNLTVMIIKLEGELSC